MKRLLVVEDDGIQRTMLSVVLRHQFAVTACDQFEASNYNWCDYDMVLLDVMMPAVDGPTLVRRAANQCGSLPVIVLYSALPLSLLRREAAALADVAKIIPLVKAGRPALLPETLRALCVS